MTVNTAPGLTGMLAGPVCTPVIGIFVQSECGSESCVGQKVGYNLVINLKKIMEILSNRHFFELIHSIWIL